MAYSLNSKIRNLKPYDPIQGTYRIRLDANESFRQPPKEILSKISDVVAKIEYNRYPDPYAEELCHAFADFYQIDPVNVMAGNGSDELISIINEAFLMKGESVMTLSPDFSMYRFYCGIGETKCFEYQKKDDYSVDIDELIRMVNDYKIRMLIFSNPCNPTSKGIKRDDIRRLVQSVDALVVLDEAYMDFWNQSMLCEAENYDNLIILKTCSKAIGMAGIRLGFAIANQTLIRTLKAVKSPYNVNIVSQKIGTLLLREEKWINSCIQELVASKNALYDKLKRVESNNMNRMTVYNSATNFIFIKISDGEKVFENLMKQGIAVRCFGNYLRITAGTLEENEDFITAFETALQ